MKITFDQGSQNYVVSDRGSIEYISPSLNDATRVAGIEPERESETPKPSDEDLGDLEDLVTLFND